MTQAMSNKTMDVQASGRSDAAGSFFTIGDMARAYNVTLRALRFYEDRGLIQPLRQGVSRLYDRPTRAKLETILKGKKLGFTLLQIADMVSAAESPVLCLKETQIVQQITQLERKREELDFAIRELRQAHAAMAGTATTSDMMMEAASASHAIHCSVATAA